MIRGVNVFPSQIESVLLGIEGLEPHYQIIVERTDKLDSLELRVEVSEGIFSDEVRVLQQIERRIAKDIKDYLGVTATVKLVEPKSLQRFEGKAQRVIDKRQL